MKAERPRKALSGLRSLKRCACAAASAVGRSSRARAVLDGRSSVRKRPEPRHAAAWPTSPGGKAPHQHQAEAIDEPGGGQRRCDRKDREHRNPGRAAETGDRLGRAGDAEKHPADDEAEIDDELREDRRHPEHDRGTEQEQEGRGLRCRAGRDRGADQHEARGDRERSARSGPHEGAAKIEARGRGSERTVAKGGCEARDLARDPRGGLLIAGELRRIERLLQHAQRRVGRVMSAVPCRPLEGERRIGCRFGVAQPFDRRQDLFPRHGAGARRTAEERDEAGAIEAFGEPQGLAPMAGLDQSLDRVQRKIPDRLRPGLRRVGLAQGLRDRLRRAAVAPAELGEPRRQVRPMRPEEAFQRCRRRLGQDARLEDALARLGRHLGQPRFGLPADELVALPDAPHRPVQTPAEGGAQGEADARIAAQDLREAFLIEAKQLAVAVGDHACRARLAGQQRHLAEAAARPQRRDPKLAVGAGAADKHPEGALRDDVEAVARLALDAGGLALAEADAVEIGRELRQRDAVEPGEQVGSGKELGRAPPACGLFVFPPHARDWPRPGRTRSRSSAPSIRTG